MNSDRWFGVVPSGSSTERHDASPAESRTTPSNGPSPPRSPRSRRPPASPAAPRTGRRSASDVHLRSRGRKRCADAGRVANVAGFPDLVNHHNYKIHPTILRRHLASWHPLRARQGWLLPRRCTRYRPRICSSSSPLTIDGLSQCPTSRRSSGFSTRLRLTSRHAWAPRSNPSPHGSRRASRPCTRWCAWRRRRRSRVGWPGGMACASPSRPCLATTQAHRGPPLPRSFKPVADPDRRLLLSTELSMSKWRRTQGCGYGSYGNAAPLQFYA